MSPIPVSNICNTVHCIKYTQTQKHTHTYEHAHEMHTMHSTVENYQNKSDRPFGEK